MPKVGQLPKIGLQDGDIWISGLFWLSALGMSAVPSLSGGKNNVPIQLLNEIRFLPILTVGQLPAFAGYGVMIKLGKVGGKNNMTIKRSLTTVARLSVSSPILKPTEIGWTY